MTSNSIIRGKIFAGVGEIANILSSCIEVYPSETFGLLAGTRTKKRVLIRMAYPIQLVERRKGSVEPKSQKKLERTIRILDSMGLEFFGFYHSHPDWTGTPSKSDLVTSIEQILSFEEDRPLLELIVEVKKKKYAREHKPDFVMYIENDILKGYLKDIDSRYDYKLLAYWIEASWLEYETFPNVYKGSLNLIENEAKLIWPDSR